MYFRACLLDPYGLGASCAHPILALAPLAVGKCCTCLDSFWPAMWPPRCMCVLVVRCCVHAALATAGLGLVFVVATLCIRPLFVCSVLLMLSHVVVFSLHSSCACVTCLHL